MNPSNRFSQIGKGARRLDPVAQLPVYRRHILIDHHRKVIYIEVMGNHFTKNLNAKEFFDINNGHWQDYVPKDHIEPVRACIASGYALEPAYLIGMESEEYRVIQIANLEAGKKDVFNQY